MTQRKKETLVNQLMHILKTDGVLTSQELTRKLEISRPTLSRLISKAPHSLMRLGKTRAINYGATREIPGLGSKLPMFKVNESGQLSAVGNFIILHKEYYAAAPQNTIFSGLPPEMFDMAPQGFMGRAFIQKFANELNLPTRLENWSNDHILIAISRRGEDLPGNLIIGKESAERFTKLNINSISHKQYTNLALLSLSGQPIGSSAGGEQPKFSAYVAGRQCIIKFAGIDHSKAQLRWKDLLISEFIALQILKEHQISSSKAELVFQGKMVFLVVERFDRTGPKGRCAVLTLAAIENLLFGARDSWSSSAERLERANHIDKNTERCIKLLDAFGVMIADSDRHFHNIAFFSQSTFDHKFQTLKFKLAPAFDKLPMLFAPISGQVIEKKFELPIPSSEMLDVWEEARDLAIQFWDKVSKEKTISEHFRKIARFCKNILL
ncbi:MAG: HipA domain-containing protein [Deltaproteobacteria bacterium]|nr:HipA domain-containing protein [Deltaproteobacteria bacterium]